MCVCVREREREREVAWRAGCNAVSHAPVLALGGGWHSWVLMRSMGAVLTLWVGTGGGSPPQLAWVGSLGERPGCLSLIHI